MNRPQFRHIVLAWFMCLPLMIAVATHRGVPLLVLGAVGASLFVWSLAWLLANRWEMVAWAVSRPAVARWIVTRAVCRNVCLHIPDKGDNVASYMERRWLLNVPVTQQKRRWRLPFEIRVHWIKRADADRDRHDHPWNWRTIILFGWYEEDAGLGIVRRSAGDTAGKLCSDSHMITAVSPGGVWTLFIVGPYRQKWGFHTPTGKVPYDKYDRLNGF